MAIKNITPTTSIAATSTCAGTVRARRKIAPASISATSTVAGLISTQAKSYGCVPVKRFQVFATTEARYRPEGESRFQIRRVMSTNDLVSARD